MKNVYKLISRSIRRIFSLNVRIFNFAIVVAAVNFAATAQVNNSPIQSLPYYNDFGVVDITTASLTSSGFSFFRDNGVSPRIRTSEALVTTVPDANFQFRTVGFLITDASRTTTTVAGHIDNGLVTTSYRDGTNAALLFNMGARTMAASLNVSTTGVNAIAFSYSIKQIENIRTSTGMPDYTKVNCILQYRFANGQPWTTVPNTNYSTNGKVVDQITNFSGMIPVNQEQQAYIQFRWVTYQDFVTELDEYLSFGLDNVSISGVVIPASKLAIETLSPSTTFNLLPNSVIVTSRTSDGTVWPVISTTSLLVTASNSTLTGTVTGIMNAGSSSATISGFSFPLSNPSTSLVVSATSGDALQAATLSGVTVNQTSPATKLSIVKVVPASGNTILPNVPFTLVIQALDAANNSGLVSQNTNLTISATGRGVLGTTTATLSANTSTLSITGITYSLLEKGVSITVSVSNGDALTPSSSNIFNVGYFATKAIIEEVQPLGNYIVNKPLIVKVKLVDENDSLAVLSENKTLSIVLTNGTGSLSGTLTGEAIAYSTSSLIIKNIFYDKVEDAVKFAASISGINLGESEPLNFKADPLAGFRILYQEDFEKTVKVVGQNPSLPTGMKMFNLDGQTAVTATYPSYKNDAWVIVRNPQEPYFGKGPDVVSTPTYWDNTGSNLPDSNYVAYATSWFNDATKDANRWLVTPGILMEGGNFKFKFQAKSATSSGNFKDVFEVYASTDFNGSSIIVDDWSALDIKNLTTNEVSKSVTASTLVINYEASINEAVVRDQIVYFAIRLVTKADKGDRLAVDNLVVTSGGTTSTKEDLYKSAYIYPNPAEGSLYVANVEAGSVQISDVTGVPVLAASIAGKSAIDISSLAPGVYVVKVQSATGVSTAKFIKK